MLYNEKCAVESINKISNWHKLYHVKLKGIPFGEVSNVVNSFFVGCLLAVDWRIERMPEKNFFLLFIYLCQTELMITMSMRRLVEVGVSLWVFWLEINLAERWDFKTKKKTSGFVHLKPKCLRRLMDRWWNV